MAQAIQGTIRGLYQRHGALRYMCNFAKNTALFDYKKPEADLLFVNLKNATNTRNVLDMVAVHSGIMNNKHIMQALRTLFVLQKQGSSELSTTEILGNKDFRRLCRQLRNQAGAIELNETIEALKVVTYVGVPADATIIQVLLQLIRHHINSLNLHQIIFMDFLLSQYKPTPLGDALKIALPIVFEIHLPIKMDFDNAAHLSEYLFFMSRNPMKEQSVQRLVNALLNHADFDAKTAKSIVWSICDMEGNEMFRPLMKKAIDSLVVHLDELTFNDMETTLSKLISRFSKKCSYFYDETFCDSVANYVIDKDLGYKYSIYVLRKFGRINHFHKFLLDYMAKKIHQNPDLIGSADPVDVYSISVATSMTEYRPQYWDHVQELISKCDNITTTDRKEILWVKFGAALSLLNIYKIDVLTKCLSESFLRSLFKKKFMSDFENYSTIWQCIKLFKPELNCLLTPNFSPELVTKFYRQPLEFPLESALHKALGGDKYVKTDLFTKMGFHIDHAVVFRKGGYPVALDSTKETEFIEDIEVQPEHQLVLILGLRYFNYTLNQRRIRNSVSFLIKLLESKGYYVVPVCVEVWENLPDFEKIPYLMRTIKERTDCDLKVSESVI